MGQHKSHRDELIKMGFDFERQPNIGGWNATGWNRIKSALLHYKHLYGHLRVSAKFIIPSEDDNDEGWPLETLGIKLGVIVKKIRLKSKGHYKSHKDELIEMGFDYGRQIASSKKMK